MGLTEEDVRRITREEIEKLAREDEPRKVTLRLEPEFIERQTIRRNDEE